MWTLSDIESLLNEEQAWTLSKEQESLVITNQCGISAYLAVAGEQILVETLLFKADQVIDKNRLNKEILKTHKIFPLTAIGINTIEGEDYYAAFGALSSQSAKSSIIIEVTKLFQNVEVFLDVYQDHLNTTTDRV